jgi:hypothetical protein
MPGQSVSGPVGPLVEPETERMPVRIQEHPYRVLGLKLGQDRTTGGRVSSRGLEILDLDLKMQHHLLLPRSRRPCRALIAGLGLERQPDLAVPRPHQHPVVFSPNLQVEQASVRRPPHPIRRVDQDTSHRRGPQSVAELLSIGSRARFAGQARHAPNASRSFPDKLMLVVSLQVGWGVAVFRPMTYVAGAHRCRV